MEIVQLNAEAVVVVCAQGVVPQHVSRTLLIQLDVITLAKTDVIHHVTTHAMRPVNNVSSFQ